MASPKRTGPFAVLVAASLAAAAAVVMLLPADASAGPVDRRRDGGASVREGAAAEEARRGPSRGRRNISWYKQHSDFWNWYKYFTDNGNQEAVQELDRIYLAYLQNKNRAEGRRSYKAYLRHLGEIYKSCADSDDPDCVASYTGRPKPEPLKTCDPTKDASCLYAALVAGKSPYLPLVLPAPAKAPAPLFARSATSAKDPQSGYHYYAPSSTSFLSKEQKAELLRVCAAEDVECLQYHLRAAYGYPHAAHLGCDPRTDPACKPQLGQKAPSGLYLKYPHCDPLRDPYCAYAASQVAPRAPNCNPLFEEGCNPLTATKYAAPPESYKGGESEEGAALRAPAPAADHYNDPYGMYRDANAHANRVADPYAAYHQASAPVAPPAAAADPYAAYRQAGAPVAPPAAADPHATYRQAGAANDPYAMLRRFMANAQGSDPYAPRTEAAPESNSNDPFSAAAPRYGHRDAREHYSFSHPAYEEPAREERHPLGPPGKTKEGYDCFIGYDRECFPVQPAEPRSGAHRRVPYAAEAYEPHLNADGARDGVLEPANPHCDPEYDRDCRLRRVEPEQPRHQAKAEAADGGRQPEQDPYEAEPHQSGQEEPRVSNQPPPPQGMPSLQDILKHFGEQFPEQDDYRKK
ncbi:actinodin1 [Syngnathoides biaculeatus]|uniref:actinodin1 n=1 Tax=Syngnathoides biaculeatus TaxID=300417 RepID=UPI002ADE11EF|nr:actinodin1 [Syngnathoides biaculeatus]